MTLLDELKNLKANGPTEVADGICGYVGNTRGLTELFRKWPEFTGYDRFPVPHPEYAPYSAYMSIDNLWIGEYGEARKRLLDFCITELEKSE